jgi:hypothetical protein
MITFSRSQLVGTEFLDEETVRFHGTQEDHIYAMEIEMDVRIADGRILAIKGWMKRYTTPVCPRAIDRLQDAVGVSLREEGWMPLVMREIGRKGCEHFAEIICECGRCLDQARMTRDLATALKGDPSAHLAALAGQWAAAHPERQGATLTATSM